MPLLNFEIGQFDIYNRNSCQRSSSETAPQSFMKLYSWSGHTYAYTQESVIWFFLEHMDLNGQKYIIICKLCETG